MNIDCLEASQELILEFFHNHTSIMTTKTKGITQGGVHHSLLGLVESEIQATI